jgi:hypothetical protein
LIVIVTIFFLFGIYKMVRKIGSVK